MFYSAYVYFCEYLHNMVSFKMFNFFLLKEIHIFFLKVMFEKAMKLCDSTCGWVVL